MQHEIDELRNQVRNLKRMLFGFLALVVSGSLLAATSLQPVPDVIQAKKFEVVDSTGKTAITLSSKKGGGIVRINNDRGEQVAVLESFGTGAFLNLMDLKLKRQTVLSADKTLGAGLILWDDCNGKMPMPGYPLAAFSISDGSTPSSGGFGSLVLEANTNALDGTAIVFATQNESKTETFFGLTALDKNGNEVVKAGLNNGTTGVLETLKPKQP